MKRLLSSETFLGMTDAWLLLLRLFASTFMIYGHGSGTLAKLLPGGTIEFDDVIGIGPLATVLLVVFSEIICSVAVIIGLYMRLALIPLFITMIVAAFIAHPVDPFKKKELALLYLLIYTTLFIFGSGRYSVEQAIAIRKKPERA